MAVAIDAFSLPPVDALQFFRRKGLSPSFAWQDMLHDEHDAAFTVAKMLDVDMLSDVRDAVDAALADGITFADFRRNLEPTLMERGWWGKAMMVDPLTGEEELVQLGSTRRLRVIFETNLKTAYAAGHWAKITDQAAAAPYLMYDAVDDDRTRPEHAQWDGQVFRVDDPFWESWYPPNGWMCRCSVIQIDEDQLRALGKSAPDTAPEVPTRQWANPRTGEIHNVPAGIDPGWAYHPGRSRAPELRARLIERSMSVPDIGNAAVELVETRKPPTLSEAVDLGHKIADELLSAGPGEAAITADVVRRRISDRLRREVGEPVTAATTTRSAAAQMVQEASRKLPSDWVATANSSGPLHVRQSSRRGWHYTVTEAHAGKRVKLPQFGRIDAQRGAGYIVAGNPTAALHEFVHRIQHTMPEIDDLFQQLHQRRTAGKPLERLSSIAPRGGYGRSELARRGGYLDPYFGKEYGDSLGLSYRGRAGALEVMSMSFECLLARDEATFFLFRELDRELFDLTVGVLFSLRPGGRR